MSGGEQQMLAIARILRTGANVILLDEPTEGLAPVIVERIGEVMRMLKGRGMTIVLVEQNFHFARKLADEAPLYDREAKAKPPPTPLDLAKLPETDSHAALLALLAHPTIASKNWVYRQYRSRPKVNPCLGK